MKPGDEVLIDLQTTALTLGEVIERIESLRHSPRMAGHQWSDLDGAERMTCSVTIEIDSEGILADDIVAEWRAWLRDAKRIDDDVIERAVLVTMATCIQYEIAIKRW